MGVILTIDSSEAVVIVRNGLDVTMNGTELVPIADGLVFRGLKSRFLDLAFEQQSPQGDEANRFLVTASSSRDERYLVRHFTTRANRFTRVRVEGDGASCNPGTLLLCLGYFWNFYETSRTSYA